MRIIVIRAIVLSCLRWFGFQVRWSFKIAVVQAAGGVFAQLKPMGAGKARRHFIRLSCRRDTCEPDEAALGKRRFFSWQF